MNKGVTLDDYRRAYDLLDADGIEERRGSFIIGHPYETERTIKDSIAFARLWGKVRENNLLNSSDYLLVVEIIYILDGNSKSYEFELKDF